MMKELGMKKLGDRSKLLRNLRPLIILFMAEVQNVQEEIKENYVIQDTQEETLSEITHEETHDETENEETFTENTLAKTIDETDNVETFTPMTRKKRQLKQHIEKLHKIIASQYAENLGNLQTLHRCRYCSTAGSQICPGNEEDPESDNP